MALVLPSETHKMEALSVHSTGKAHIAGTVDGLPYRTFQLKLQRQPIQLVQETSIHWFVFFSLSVSALHSKTTIAIFWLFPNLSELLMGSHDTQLDYQPPWHGDGILPHQWGWGQSTRPPLLPLSVGRYQCRIVCMSWWLPCEREVWMSQVQTSSSLLQIYAFCTPHSHYSGRRGQGWILHNPTIDVHFFLTSFLNWIMALIQSICRKVKKKR